MCGIALIVDGVYISNLSSFVVNTQQQQQVSPCSNLQPVQITITIDDLIAGLRRRGPDSLGTKRIELQVNGASDLEVVSCVVGYGEDKKENCCGSVVQGRNPSSNVENGLASHLAAAEMYFVGAVLQLRGIYLLSQPFVDAAGNVLIYNGEIFGGVHMSGDSNDAEVLLLQLGNCCCCQSHENMSSCTGKPIPSLLSSMKGPWALIYWQNSSRTLWFGRDAFGRRSLLVHWPTSEDSRFLLSSVSPPASTAQSPDTEADRTSNFNYWEELPCGVYSMAIDSLKVDACLSGKVMKHEWTDCMLKDLMKWDRLLVEPDPDALIQASSCVSSWQAGKLAHTSGPSLSSKTAAAHMVLTVLRKSIARRTTEHRIFKVAGDSIGLETAVPVAVLFSGGLDSMILAAILHECLDASYGIDLLNVSFEGETAPDRITARAGVMELKRIAPSRRWRLVEVDADLSILAMEMKHVKSLINPSNTYMDLNIGLALWLAAGGDGWVYEESYGQHEGCQRFKYKSKARILLVGSGADEQCAGYGRHRTKYRSSSWLGLHEEMKLDVQRIWKRNLGRDDRCIADTGKEARFPFLDEDVMKILLDFPLWEIANLDQPSGIGDKKILREVARLLGLHEAAVQPKRAIQFGSRIAQESNKRNFGSNRAANQASAGSVVFHKSQR